MRARAGQTNWSPEGEIVTFRFLPSQHDERLELGLPAANVGGNTWTHSSKRVTKRLHSFTLSAVIETS